jgi:hypothetical protein
MLFLTIFFRVYKTFLYPKKNTKTNQEIGTFNKIYKINNTYLY